MNQEEIDFWEEVNALIVPLSETKIEYRLYYNEMGEIYLYAMLEQDYPADGMYIIVDKLTYEKYGRYCVVNGALKEIDLRVGNRVHLIKSDHGYRVVAGHANIVLDDNETYSDIEFYEQIN